MCLAKPTKKASVKKVAAKRKEPEADPTVEAAEAVPSEPAAAASPLPKKKKAAKAAKQPSSAEEATLAPSVPEQAEPAAAAADGKKKKKAAKSAKQPDTTEEAPTPAPAAAAADGKKKKAAKAAPKQPAAAASSPSSAAPATEAQVASKAAKRARDAAGDAGAAVPAKKAKKTDAKKQDAGSAVVGGTAALTTEEYFAAHDITIVDGKIGTPHQKFEDIEAATNKMLVSQFKKAGFSSPSPIQSVCWPAALSGKDLIAIAKTGSGKTLGFLIPAFSLIFKSIPSDPRKPRIEAGQPPTALVVAPTRELAVQIHDESIKFGNPSKVVSVSVYGGVPSGKQIRELRRGCHLVVATPGRILDLLDLDNPPVTHLDNIQFAVLDEADQMLDMGFEPSITRIMGLLPDHHQTLMFTATWPKAIQKIAARFLQSPVHIRVGGEGLRANADVKQEFIKVSSTGERESALVKSLATHAPGKESVLVFVNKKTDCEGVVRVVKRSGLSVTAIHGDLDQDARMRALKLFRDDKVRVVVATDVASRGLDVDGVGLVVNYEFPSSGCEIWVHRVGRTGRAGKKGTAVTLFDPNGTERKHAPELLELLEKSTTPIPAFLPPLAAIVAPENERIQSKKDYFRGRSHGGGKGGGGGGGGKDWSSWGSSWGSSW